MNYNKIVEQFHKVFNHPVKDKPTIPPINRSNLRVSLIQEELNELNDAIMNENIVEIADALGDLQYVLSGAILEFGLQDKFDEIFKAIHDSNMSKLCNNLEVASSTVGKYLNEGVIAHIVPLRINENDPEDNVKYIVYRSSDLKILKSKDYKPVDIKSILS